MARAFPLAGSRLTTSRPARARAESGDDRPREARAMLFGDIKGFSKLLDHPVPVFFDVIMGCIAEVLDRFADALMFSNTWGDGLYVVLRYPQVVAENDNQEQNRVREGLERLGLPFNVALEVGNIETVKYYVAHGHGIAVVSGMCLSSEDDSIFHIIEVPEEFDGETSFGVILRQGKYLSSTLRGLLTLLEVQSFST